MLISVLLTLGLVGCESEPERKLGLDGPARVRVESLGPVDGPHAVLDDGSTPDGVTWEAAPAEVARVDGDQVHAVGPGEATVTGRWLEQTVSWTLIVEPSVQIALIDPPARVRVGETVTLAVDGRLGEQSVKPPTLTWSSSDANVAAVDANGAVTGVAPGVAYITVDAGRSRAMAEIEVAP